MARTNVPVTSLAIDAKVDAPSAVAIVHADGATIPAGGDTRKLLLVLTNTTAGTKIMTIKKGLGSQAVRAGVGDLAISFGAGNVTAQVKYVVIESARFAQADGSISIDFAADTTGFMNAYRLP
jgi:hypothetical protein